MFVRQLEQDRVGVQRRFGSVVEAVVPLDANHSDSVLGENRLTARTPSTAMAGLVHPDQATAAVCALLLRPHCRSDRGVRHAVAPRQALAHA